jgi:UDP-N-acetylglucosamine 2-epimerase (non-hydrolysing)
MKNLIVTEPLGYLDFLWLISNAKFVLTDSGGIQEETTILNIPCITLRENTERPETVKEGTNIITGTNKKKIINCVNIILKDKWKKGEIPEKWDGKSAERIVNIIRKINEIY